MFGPTWLEGVGLTPDDTKSDAAMKGMVVSVVTSMVEALSLALLIAIIGVKGAGAGAFVGVLTGAGLVAMVLLSNSMFEQRPLKVWMINAGYRLVYLALNGAILGAWQ
jgi:hypothetical protein